jgi:LemA protein
MKIRNGLLLLFASLVLSSCGYNSMVAKEEGVKQAWAQVENVYQSRADKIGQLVSTVKGAANYEQKTLTSVMEARASATRVTISADSLTPENIAKFEAAQNRLGQSVGRLLAVAENYPQLQATANFRALQDEISGTENRIAVERKRFNEAVSDYNTYIRKFPNNFTSGWFGFQQKGYFKGAEGTDKAPEINFEN